MFFVFRASAGNTLFELKDFENECVMFFIAKLIYILPITYRD